MLFMDIVANTLQFLATAFVIVLGLAGLAAIVMFFIDRTQTQDAVQPELSGDRTVSEIVYGVGRVFSAIFLCDGP